VKKLTLVKDKVVYLTFKCQVCQRFLPRAEVFYDGTIELKSGANQILADDQKPEDTRQQLEDLARQIAEADPKKLEEGVYFKKEFRLCLECRNKLVAWLKF
jgi:hypothetical protein